MFMFVKDIEQLLKIEGFFIYKRDGVCFYLFILYKVYRKNVFFVNIYYIYFKFYIKQKRLNNLLISNS